MIRLAVLGVVGPAALSVSALAQQKSMPDAQVESNVLKALAGVSELADQAIGTTTVYGTVTITGSVRDEASRDKAEQAVATAPGVVKVVDELVIGEATQPDANTSQAASDASPDPADRNMQQPADAGQQPDGQQQADAGASMPPQQQGAPQPPYSSQQGAQQQYPPYPQQAGAYPPASTSPQPYRSQQAGDSLTLPVGTYLQVRINQAMDSRHTQPGAAFDGVVVNQVVLGGMVAVPRGAQVQGQVVDVHPSGDLKGGGGLALQLTQITLEGRTYALATDPWTHQGYSKTGQTVGTTVGLGAMGALIGAVAGGGPGALLGAGIGGVAGIGLSSASHQGDATVPSEALLSFRLSQQVPINAVSQAELDRLAATMPPQMAGPQQLQRRYSSPYPYGPVAYPYGYPAPYYPYYRYR
ncbi:MAG: BON domain-containing protein [Edaphobacter sp.]|uniref:BON domain-containing protein n=1 Tax=Edaphobacter sp. TaxID=1934404 RepID=UPI00238CE0A2|nr:BON domain-containing protein [Edaphobacter sp.]MDE1177447.1 BON domain-containing protein [Edaphobacter sp.]